MHKKVLSAILALALVIIPSSAGAALEPPTDSTVPSTETPTVLVPDSVMGITESGVLERSTIYIKMGSTYPGAVLEKQSVDSGEWVPQEGTKLHDASTKMLYTFEDPSSAAGKYRVRTALGTPVEFEIVDVSQVQPAQPFEVSSVFEDNQTSHPKESRTVSYTTHLTGDGVFYPLFKDTKVNIVATVNGAKKRVASPKMSELMAGYSFDYTIAKGISSPTTVEFSIDTPAFLDQESTHLLLGTLNITKDYGTSDNLTLDNPSITGGTFDGNSTYFVSGSYKISGTAVNDFATPVKAILNRDGTPTEETTLAKNGRFSFDIKDSASYTVTIQSEGIPDKTFTMKDFGAQFTSVVFTENGPSVVVGGLDQGTSDPQGTNWFLSSPTVSITIVPENGRPLKTIRSINVTVGVDKYTRADFQENEGVFKMTLPASAFPDGSVTKLSVETSDWTGLSESFSQKIGVDSKGFQDSDVRIEVPSEATRTSWGYVSKAPLTLQLHTYQITTTSTVKVGSSVLSPVDESGKQYELEVSSGRPTFVVTDVLGRTKEVSLDLPVFVDSEAPSISIDTDLDNNQWVSSADQTLSVSFSDNLSLSSVRVEVNGKEVSSIDHQTQTPSTKIPVNLKEFSPASDGSFTITTSASDVVGNAATPQTFRVYLDDTVPSVDEFTVIGAVVEGASSQGSSDRYGFFLDGAVAVQISVSDPGVSSGLSSVAYTLRDPDGNLSSSGTSRVSNGVATVSLPTGFKGFISATVSDLVGNVSPVNQPDGIVSEDSNLALTSTGAAINLPSTPYRDIHGNPLYNRAFTAEFDVFSTQSGIRSVSFPGGSASISASGAVDGGMLAVSMDRNLVTRGKGTFGVLSDGNGQVLSVSATSRAGNQFGTESVVSVDTVAPSISVTYDSTSESGYYAANRSATISVTDANFNPNGVVIEGIAGSLGAWRQTGPTTWTASMLFSEDGDYSWTMTATDLAGNVSSTYSSGSFTIDKTVPIIDMVWVEGASKSASNERGTFFNTDRVARIVVTERNFNPSLVTVSGTGSLSGWTSSGNTHVALMSWSSEGSHSGSISLTDKAGNSSNTLDVPSFIIDKTAPKLTVSGVTSGSYYHQNTGLKVSLFDTFLDPSSVTASLIGRKGSEIPLRISLSDTEGTIVLEGFPEGAKYDDLYTLKVVSRDFAGNSSDITEQFVINRYGSDFSFMNEDINGGYFQDPFDVDIQEQTPERVDLSKVSFNVTRDGEPVTLEEGTYSISESGGDDSDWQYVYTVNSPNFQEEGSYRVQVDSEGEGGAQNTSAKIIYGFVIDRTVPEITVADLSEGSQYNPGKTASFTVRDSSGVVDMRVSFGDQLIPVDVDSSGVYTVPLPTTASAAAFKVSAVDRAGNESVLTIDGVSVAEPDSISPWVWGTGVGILAIAGGILLLAARRRSNESNEVD